MKRTNRLLRINTTAKRSRRRQAFIKNVKLHRLARQEVFFLSEKNGN